MINFAMLETVLIVVVSAIISVTLPAYVSKRLFGNNKAVRVILTLILVWFFGDLFGLPLIGEAGVVQGLGAGALLKIFSVLTVLLALSGWITWRFALAHHFAEDQFRLAATFLFSLGFISLISCLLFVEPRALGIPVFFVFFLWLAGLIFGFVSGMMGNDSDTD